MRARLLALLIVVSIVAGNVTCMVVRHPHTEAR